MERKEKENRKTGGLPKEDMSRRSFFNYSGKTLLLTASYTVISVLGSESKAFAGCSGCTWGSTTVTPDPCSSCTSCTSSCTGCTKWCTSGCCISCTKSTT